MKTCKQHRKFPAITQFMVIHAFHRGRFLSQFSKILCNKVATQNLGAHYKPILNTNLMKRVILVLTIFLSCFTLSYANDVKVSPVVLQSFNSSFKNATEVNWTVTDSYYK